MRIAIFTNNYLPNPYGISTSVDGFCRQLRMMGHEVYIFAPRWGKQHKKEENVFRYPSFKAPTKIDFSLVIPHSARIDQIIAQMDFDIVHAQHPNLLGVVGKKWARKKNVPLIFTWHSLYEHYAHYTPFISEEIAGRWAVKNAVKFANESDYVIVPTAPIKDVIQKAGVRHNRIRVVPSGIDETLFINPHGANVREKYHITDDKTVFVTISRLTKEKNVLFLAHVMTQVLQKNKDSIFLCVGEGDLQGEMQQIFNDKNVGAQVIFVGKIKRNVVKNYLKAGDIFVYASISETQGTIVTENMYIGKPIVAIEKNGVGALIENGINGISTKEDESDFVKAVQKLIDNKDLRTTMGINAQKIAKQKYTSLVCTKKLLTVYQKAINYYKNK